MLVHRDSVGPTTISFRKYANFCVTYMRLFNEWEIGRKKKIGTRNRTFIPFIIKKNNNRSLPNSRDFSDSIEKNVERRFDRKTTCFYFPFLLQTSSITIQIIGNKKKTKQNGAWWGYILCLWTVSDHVTLNKLPKLPDFLHNGQNHVSDLRRNRSGQVLAR